MNTEDFKRYKIKDETIEQTYARLVCSTCANKGICNEELRRKIDGTIKCNSHNSTFVPYKINTLAHSTSW